MSTGSGGETAESMEVCVQVGRLPSEHGLVTAFLSFVVFRVVKVLLNAYWTNGIVADKDRFRWLNVGVSFIHACGVTLWMLISIILYPDMFVNSLVYYNYATYGLVAFSAGYFFADMADIIMSKQSRACYEVLVHHVAVVVIMVYILLTCHYVGITAISLAVEVNSMFLHARKLMQMYGVDFVAVNYRTIVILNLLTFICFRFSVLVYVTNCIIVYRRCLSMGFIISLASVWATAWFINIVLFLRLVQSDLLRKGSKTRKAKELNVAEYTRNHVNNKDTKSPRKRALNLM